MITRARPWLKKGTSRVASGRAALKMEEKEAEEEKEDGEWEQPDWDPSEERESVSPRRRRSRSRAPSPKRQCQGRAGKPAQPAAPTASSSSYYSSSSSPPSSSNRRRQPERPAERQAAAKAKATVQKEEKVLYLQQVLAEKRLPFKLREAGIKTNTVVTSLIVNAKIDASGSKAALLGDILRGEYKLVDVNHLAPVYRKIEQVNGLNVLLYYWDARDGENFSGWWFSPLLGGDTVWAYNSSQSSTPPARDWVMCSPDVSHEEGDVDEYFFISPL